MGRSWKQGSSGGRRAPCTRTAPSGRAAWTFGAALLLLLFAVRGGAQDASTSLYVRTDSDQTTVITPRLRVGGEVAEGTRLDVSYAVDVWTSASVDIRTSASQAITEQRDEINVDVAQEIGEFKLNGGYRFSSEPDYTSHGGSLGVSADFADRNATLAVTGSAFFDTVGRVGDPAFARAARSYTARVGFTQVLGRGTLAQGIYEIGRADGYLSSPYRRIGILSADGSCASAVPVEQCIPETNPEERLRHAVALRARHGFADGMSLGAGYRFYIDDWNLVSHTAEGDLSVVLEANTLLTLRYRLYMQSAAAHYRARLMGYRAGAAQFYSRDKELSPFTAHRIALDAEHPFTLDDLGTKLRAAASLGWTVYQYSNFVPLNRITALEATLALGLEL